MIKETFAVPLSPPNSPRMSDAEAKTAHYRCHNTTEPPHQSPSYFTSQQYLSYQNNVQNHPYEETRTSLRSYGGFPSLLTPSNSQTNHNLQIQPYTCALGDSSNIVHPQYSQTSHSTEPLQTRYSGSVPASPSDRLTPRSSSETKDQHDEDDFIEYGGDEHDEDAECRPLTAQELRAQKRKMKRFRLTHNQTRFLMSEFARQAHPDAAHRERLAREIPGLSARQVQVWFQNRRAKLKRLTADDRDRMMQSRQLPSGFDTTHTLHTPFGPQPSAIGSSVSGIGSYPTYGDNSNNRPMTLDTLRRVPDYGQYNDQYATSAGVSPASGAFGFTPPHSSCERLSPGSTTSIASPFTMQQQAPYDVSRRTSGFSGIGVTPYCSSATMPRLPLHERLSGTAGEVGSSHLRASVSYSALGSTDVQQSQQCERAQSLSEHGVYSQQRHYLPRTMSASAVGETPSYGLDLSYMCSVNYPQQQQPQQTTTISPMQQQAHTEGPELPTLSYTNSSTQMTPYQSYATHHPVQTFQNAYPHSPMEPMLQAQQSGNGTASTNSSYHPQYISSGH